MEVLQPHWETPATAVLARLEVSGVAALEYHLGALGGGWRSARVGLPAEMGPLRKSMSVRLEEGVHARLRRQSLRSGVPTSALVRALVHRWLDEQDEATTGPLGSERERQPGLFGEEGGL